MIHNRRVSLLTFLFVISFCASLDGLCAASQAASFSLTPLGDLPDGNFQSVGLGISADGSTATGYGQPGLNALDTQAFRWTSAGGMVGLGYLPFSTRSGGKAASADGAVIVGEANEFAAGPQAFRWTAGGGMVSLGESTTRALAVSADGSIVAGVGSSGVGFRWTNATGVTLLADLAGGSVGSEARGISADGSVIVGWSYSTAGREAARWTGGGAPSGLGDLPGGTFSSEANAISGNGQVIVGMSVSAAGEEAFRWTAGGMVGLGDLPGGSFRSSALAVSANGSTIVGTSSGNGNEAFLWTATTGMVSLRDYLVAGGLSAATNWQLAEATGISADGTTIVGWGRNPSGGFEAWVVTIPEPGSFALAGAALAMFGVRAIKRSRRNR
jgi:probable HAF family extracellular repeat protein